MYDVLIRNGLIYDGTGSEPFTSDIAVFGDRIALIGKNGSTRHFHRLKNHLTTSLTCPSRILILRSA